MRLSWNESAPGPPRSPVNGPTATYKTDETQSFYIEFFEIFGVQRRTVARYEEHVKRLDNTSGFIDLFWPGVLLIEQKSAGHDLTTAGAQATTYFDACRNTTAHGTSCSATSKRSSVLASRPQRATSSSIRRGSPVVQARGPPGFRCPTTQCWPAQACRCSCHPAPDCCGAAPRPPARSSYSPGRARRGRSRPDSPGRTPRC